MPQQTPGEKFRAALIQEKPLQIVGTINAFTALLAKEVGFKALYLSGAGIANQSYGLPDLGLTTLENVLTDAQRILNTVDLPLLVDIDTGWGPTLMIQKTIKEMIRAGVAAVHIEDQTTSKRCGQLSGKSIVSVSEMVDRIKAAADAKYDSTFYLIARCDAFEKEGIKGVIERSKAYYEAGADAIFPEALPSLDDYNKVKKELKVPVLANMTEFGIGPLYTISELSKANIDMVLYPLTVTRAMNATALQVLEELRKKGSQKEVMDLMMSREQLYKFLNYDSYEQ